MLLAYIKQEKSTKDEGLTFSTVGILASIIL